MTRRTIASVLVTILSLQGGAAAQYDGCVNGAVADIGDGRCNAENNNPSCGFDGGDVSILSRAIILLTNSNE